MKKNILFIFSMLLLVTTAVVSCKEDDNTIEEFPDWQETNTVYFYDLYNKAKTNTDGSWKRIKTWSKEDSIQGVPTDYIVVKVLEEGKGSGCPMYTDSVRIHYRGRLIPSTSYADGYVFDQTYTGNFNPQTCTPIKGKVCDYIDGFTTALQHMHIGDNWRVYIPYTLAYGESANDRIPAYSTLVFDIYLSGYYRIGTPTTSVKAKSPVWIEK